MRAVYDLGQSPLTFDFITWLVAVEKLRLEQKESDVRVVFVYGERDLTYRDQAFTSDRKAWRLHNLLVPLCRLLPSVSGYEVGGTGEQTTPYKPDEKQRPASFLRSSAAAQSIIASWSRSEQPIVTITVRQSDLQPQRNSNIAEWLKVAKWLKACGYCPVFVPDTEAMITGEPIDFEGYRVASAAALNQDLRMALYERALLNCFTSGGPFTLPLYADLPFFLCRVIFPELITCTEAVHRKYGFTPEEWQGPCQRVVWSDDSYEAVVPVLQEMLPACLKRERPVPELYAFAVRKPERIKNINATFNLSLPQMCQLPVHERVAGLVCYGPSLKDTWRLLPDSHEDIYTVSGAHDFLLSRRIVPSGHIECDPREHKAAFTAKPHIGVEYLLASCAHPKVFENVKDCSVQLWHAWDGDDIELEILKLWPDAFTLLGGSNVGLRAIAVLSALGYRKFSLYSMDCSLLEGRRHAGPHGGKDQPPFEVRLNSGKKYMTTRQLISGAREALQLISLLSTKGFTFSVHGEGLLLEMLKEAVQPKKETDNVVALTV